MARQLASIKKIQEIRSIPGADRICQYRIDGWWVIDKIDQYSIGDSVVYCEIDSWIPNQLAPWLSKDREPKEYDGIKGERLKTIKMKGVLSQGLILPMSSIVSQYGISSYYEGMDLTETLGIVKYEPPIPAQLAGLIKGNFPSFVPKTDQTRIQSLGKELNSWIENNLSFEISEKNDGSSMTLLINDGEIQVCSRNLSLKEDYNNTFWKVAIDEKLIDKIKDYYEETKNNIALQFELIGPKIQSNPYKLDKFKATLFDIFDIDQQCYLTSEKRIEFCQKYNIEHIKVIDNNFVMTSDITIDKLLEMAEGKSYLNSKTEREGLVFKCLTDSSITFKAISNKFLLKGD